MSSGKIEDIPQFKSKWQEFFDSIPQGEYRSFGKDEDEEGRAAMAALRSFQTRYSKKRYLDYSAKRIKGETFILHNKSDGVQQ